MKTPCLTCGKQSPASGFCRTCSGGGRAWCGRCTPRIRCAFTGPRAQAFAEGQERFDTPCAPGSCYGELLRQNAQVMMVGVTFACNTSVHCIEEIANVPGRLTAEHHPLFVRDQSGRLLSVPSRRHQNANSDHYVKLEPVMFHRNVLRRVPFGNAECLLFRGKDLLAVTLELLKKDPDLFGSGAPVPPEWY